jgi:hypothetical protein
MAASDCLECAKERRKTPLTLGVLAAPPATFGKVKPRQIEEFKANNFRCTTK